MKLILPNWYEFNNDEVSKKFEGNPTFVACFCVNGNYKPVSVYHSKNPNRDKGHKDYMLLYLKGQQLYVAGMDLEEISKFKDQDAIHCHNCDDVVYSVMRHDMRSCSCEKVSIDGGNDYTKVTREPNALYTIVSVDLLTGNITNKKAPDSSEA